MNFTLSFKDVLDIGIISFFLYLVLIFLLKKRFAFFLVLGILLWYLIFLLSSQFNLSLTNFVFKWFISFGLLLIIFFVLAQEFRDFFYFSGTLGFSFFRYFKIKNNVEKELIEIVSQAVQEMAEEKTGAIIVFEGNDKLDEFISNGYLLDGFLSKSLILSIFDKHSPGHDGAMIIRNNKIYKFATHLPLGRTTTKIEEHNLRHRAGIGISEVADCLVIIVSEEKGEISVVSGGKIEKIKNIFDLKEKLFNFLEKRSKPSLSFDYKLLLKHIFIFIISLITSLLLFNLIITSKTPIVQKNFIIPIEFKNIPNNLVIKEFRPTELTITLKGSEVAFDILNPNELKVIVDLKNYKDYSFTSWNNILVGEKNVEIKIPQNLEIVTVSPSNIRFLTKKIEEDN